MDATARKALIAEFEAAHKELLDLQKTVKEFSDFNGAIHQGLCQGVQDSLERVNGNTRKRYIVVKRAARCVLVVKMPLYGPEVSNGCTVYWSEPKEFSDLVNLLAIKTPEGVLTVLQNRFKNHEGRTYPTKTFIERDWNIIAIRARIHSLEAYVQEHKEGYEAALVDAKLENIVNKTAGKAPKTKTRTPGTL
jgi:hypothetical protein